MPCTIPPVADRSEGSVTRMTRFRRGSASLTRSIWMRYARGVSPSMVAHISAGPVTTSCANAISLSWPEKWVRVVP